MSTTYLDLAGLAPNPDIGRVYIDALGLEGTLVPEEERLALLLTGLKEGDQVYTGPGARDFWMLAPSSVGVLVMPDKVELPRSKRAESVLEWRLRLRGITLSEARKWVGKAPTPKHSKHHVYKFCEQEALGFRPREVQAAKLEVVGEPKVFDRPFTYYTVLTGEMFGEVLGWLQESVRTAKVIGLDVEADTRGKMKKGKRQPDPRKDVLVGIGLSFDQEHNYYVPLNGPLRKDSIIQALNHYADKLAWVGWHCLYDTMVSRKAGVNLRAAIGDGLGAATVLQREQRGLKGTVHEVLGYVMEDFDHLLDSNNATEVSQVDPERVAPYCCGDAYLGLKATELLEQRVRDDPLPSQAQLYWQMEMPIQGMLVEMTEAGLPINPVKVLDRLMQAKAKKEQIVEEVRRVVGDQDFNPGSSKQVAEELYEKRGLPVQGLSKKTGEPSVDLRALLRNREREPYLIQLLVLERALTKQIGTYLMPWMQHHRERRLVTLWGQYIVPSGRFSSRDPDLQNLPLMLRDLVEGDFCIGDYSQLEMRVAAFLSREPGLIKVFEQDGDIHEETCQRVFGVSRKSDEGLNVAAKAINFAGMLYGAGGFKVVELVELQALKRPEVIIRIPTIDEATGWLKEAAKAYPRYTYWKNNIVLPFVRERGYSVTAYGRRWALPDINSQDLEKRQGAERKAVSLCVQGTAGDLVKRAMLRVREVRKGRVLLQNHDEIISELEPGMREDEREDYRIQMQDAMELGQPLGRGGVRLKVEPKLVGNWKDAK